jgi:class 3 adenylate cyclase
MGNAGPSWGAPKPSVAPRCSRCFQGAASDQKFCGACGTLLPRRCERKHVTVLLSDVSGFTAMSERLDPEDVRDILDRAFEIILDTVHVQGGTINQFLGDGVMALFEEAPGHDDHATRALRAALSIEARLAPLRSEVMRTHRVAFRVRIGLHTGSVVMGMIGAGLRSDYVPQGETTAVAARLVAIARPGDVLASDRTLEHAEGAFLARDAGAITGDVESEPQRAYVVSGELRERVDAEAGLLVEM